MNHDEADIGDFVFAGIVGLLALILVGIACNFSKGDLASWVQAIGSIAAIVGAWLGIKHQIATAVKVKALERRAQDAELADACYVVGMDVAVALRNMATKLRESQERRRFKEIGTERVQSLINLVDAVMQKNLPPKLFAHLVPLRRELAYTLTALREHNRARQQARIDEINMQRRRASKARQIAGEIERIFHAG